jgi:hypothetical protein
MGRPDSEVRTGWTRSNVRRISAYAIVAVGAGVAFLAALGVAVAVTSSDQVAVIVNSGSTNTAGFKITVHSSGQSTAIMQNRAGVAQSALRAFTVSSKQAGSFFADLKAAKAAPATQGGCMKSASFGTSTHVEWQGWSSPDLDCPSDDAAITTLKNDVSAIRTAAGISPLPFLHHPAAEGPLHAGSPPP